MTTKKTILIRAIPMDLIERLEVLRQAWLHDISFAGLVRECIRAGLAVLERER